MRSIALFWLVVLLAVSGLAEAKCRFKTDDTGLQRGKRYTVSAKMTSYVRFEFWRRQGNYFINAVVGTVLSGINANVDQTSSLRLTLDNGEVLSLTPLADSRSRRTFLGFGVNRKISGGVYRLPADAVQTLAEIPVVSIEFQYKNDGDLEARKWSTRRGDKKNIKKGAACLMS